MQQALFLAAAIQIFLRKNIINYSLFIGRFPSYMQMCFCYLTQKPIQINFVPIYGCSGSDDEESGEDGEESSSGDDEDESSSGDDEDETSSGDEDESSSGDDEDESSSEEVSSSGDDEETERYVCLRSQYCGCERLLQQAIFLVAQNII